MRKFKVRALFAVFLVGILAGGIARAVTPQEQAFEQVIGPYTWTYAVADYIEQRIAAGVAGLIGAAQPSSTVCSGVAVPAWLTSARPPSPTNGLMGYNLTTGYCEAFSSALSNWSPTQQAAAAAPPSAASGDYQTTNYTLPVSGSLSDCAARVVMTSASPLTLTLPAGAPLNCHATVQQGGAGTVTVVPAAGGVASLSAYQGFNATGGQGAVLDVFVDAASPSNTHYNVVGQGSAAPTTPGIVTGVTISPATGLLTTSSSSGAGNTAVVSVAFSLTPTVTGTPTYTLTDGTVCPYAAIVGLKVTFNCSWSGDTAGTHSTPISASAANPTGNTYLGSAASGAIALPGGATINSGGSTASLTGADGVLFAGLAANTNPLYFLSPTGVDTGSGTGACPFSAPCATPTFVKGLMEANAVKAVYLLTGTYTFSSPCNFTASNGGFTVNTVVCLTSTSDNGTSYLGYPNALGPSAVVVNGLSSSPTSGLGAFAEIGTSGTTVSDVVVDGFELENFALEGLRIWYTGGVVTVSNMVMKNFFSDTAHYTGGGPVSIGQSWHLIYVAHNVMSNCGQPCITGPNSSPTSAGQQSGGGVVFDGNILINGCDRNDDCGSLYEYDQSHTVSAVWSNNIIGPSGDQAPGGSGSGHWIYFDDYTGNITASGNQMYGATQWGVQIHGGDHVVLTNGLFDATDMSTACPGTSCGDNATLGYYVQSSLAPTTVNGYSGAMNGNQLNHSVVINTGAAIPPAFQWIWSKNGPANYPPQNNPSFTGNNYYSAVGTWNPCANGFVGGGNTNCEFQDTTAITTNPGASFTTDSWGARHYVLANPPGGFSAFRTDQGPH